MKFTIDTDTATLVLEGDDDAPARTLPLYGREAFEQLSDMWLKVGWDQKYPYTFSWFGRPVIQLPEDMIRTQEVIYQLKPDVVVETGVAHGGSLVFYASLLKAMGKGRVIGIDIEIRPHNREAIEAHEYSDLITLFEGDSVSTDVVDAVKDDVKNAQTVLVLLDSNHTKAHVLAELEAYHGLVTPGSYIVATDGIMRLVHDAPRGAAEWITDNPMQAALEFAENHPEFEIVQPEWPFNESDLRSNVTHWPGAWLRRSTSETAA
jgi:cephalosporin hydroxylase